MSHKNVLLVNPPVYDFACFDHWLKPLGLLYISKILKNNKFNVFLLDYMDRFHPFLEEKTKDKDFGQGKFYSVVLKEKPEVLKNIPRKWRRYGLPREQAEKFLKRIPKPDIILLTSVMTYWYYGVIEARETLKEIFPEVQIILGGNYATLLEEHALLNVKPDFLIKGTELFQLKKFLEEKYSRKLNFPDFKDFPEPDFSFYKKVSYITLRTSFGCPFNCSYCAIKRFYNRYVFKDPLKIVDEIISFHKSYNVKDFVFYDDALIGDRGNNLKKILKSLIKGGYNFRFHTPNGLHARFLDKELADLFFEAKFVEPRLSLETVNEKKLKETGDKLKLKDFENSVKFLYKAGYKEKEIGCYIMLGLPGESLNDVRKTIDFAKNLGLKIRLAEYSIVPGTREAEFFSNEILKEPLLHNNSIYPGFKIEDWKKIEELKLYARS